jgi:hypothetical protein
MRQKGIYFLVLVFAFFWSCKTVKVSDTPASFKEQAIAASSEGNLEVALQNWDKYFSQLSGKGQPIAVGDYVTAANDAVKAENISKSLAWFDAARLEGYDGADMHLALASIFRKQDNLSRELTSLQFLAEKYPEIAGKEGIHARLFEIYMEIDKDKALGQWNKLDQTTRETEPFLENYFSLNKALDNKSLCDSLSQSLLEINPDNIAALEWNAEKYFWQAENRYQIEMDKYNKKRTHVQYQFLLNELKKISADFVKSRDYFEKLWKINEKSSYAVFLTNIYTRLDNPEKAQFYKKFTE